MRLRDSRAIYVEPMAYVTRGSERLLAGYPVYTWTRAHGDSARLDRTAAYVGLLIGDSAVSPLPSPMPDAIVTDIRLRADTGRWFHAVFARAAAPDKQGHDPRILSYWYGRTDGVTWDAIEPLPMPAMERLVSREASELVAPRGALMLAVPFGDDGRRDVAIYVREQGQWRMEILSTHSVAYVAIATGDTPLLYVVRPDTTNMPDMNSLSLFTRDSAGWRDHGVLVRGARSPIHHLETHERSGAWTLSWFTRDVVSHVRTVQAARLARDGTLAERAIVAEGVIDVWPMRSHSGPTRWAIATHAGDRQLLSLVEWGKGLPVVRDVVANPFEGQLLTYEGSDGAVAVGPVLDRVPGAESLVSGTLRFELRCNARVQGGPDR